MKTFTVRRLASMAMLAAVYAALTMGLGFMSYKTVQFRVAEALCVLPFFFPWTTWGLTAGCLIANLLSPYGPVDVVLGTLATLLSCLAVAALGRGDRRSWMRCILACAVPVISNAVIVGAVIAFGETNRLFSGAFWPVYSMNALSVGFEEAIVLYALGLPLLRRLPESRFCALLA